MRLNSMKIVRLSIILLLLSLTGVMLWDGCLRAPIPLKLLKLEISGYGIVEVPEGVSVVHHNWIHPHNRIELTFNKEMDPEQEIELLPFQSGSLLGVIHPEHSQAERRYHHYLVRKDKLIIQSIEPKTGLPMIFFTLVLPAELRAKDGTTLGKDTFLWLCGAFRPTPQSWIQTGDRSKDVPLTLPVWGKEDGRTIAYLLKDTHLFNKPDEQGEQLVELLSGHNVEILETQDEWSQVKVYYPKYSFTDPKLKEIPADFDVWQSDLVNTFVGYLPNSFLHIIPRPRNTHGYVTVKPYFMGHDLEDKVIAVRVNTLPIFSGTGGLKPGDRLTKAQLDLLEVRHLWRVDYWTAGDTYLSTPIKPDPESPHGFSYASRHDPWSHHPQYGWSEEQYKRYLEIRRSYTERMEEFWKAYQVAPKYERVKDGSLENFKRSVKMQDIWVSWSRVDRELKMETFVKLVAEGFGKTPEEKEKITKIFTEGGPTLDDRGFINFINSSYVRGEWPELIKELEEEYEKLKFIGLDM